MFLWKVPSGKLPTKTQMGRGDALRKTAIPGLSLWCLEPVVRAATWRNYFGTVERNNFSENVQPGHFWCLELSCKDLIGHPQLFDMGSTWFDPTVSSTEIMYTVVFATQLGSDLGVS